LRILASLAALLLAGSLSACRSGRVTGAPVVAAAPARAVAPAERPSSHRAATVVARRARDAKRALPLPRAASTGGRVRPASAEPAPRRAWFDLLPE
jgi:hypothetical protein